MSKFNETTLAILAGGNALRMQGANKALLKHNGITFINRIVNELSELFAQTIIISNTNDIRDLTPFSVYKDIFAGKGPLGGIHAALHHSLTPWVFIVSCDMPLVNAITATKIISHINESSPYGAIVPLHREKIEPLFAIYSTKTIYALADVLSGNNLSIKRFLACIKTKYVELPDLADVDECFTNINTLEDLNSLNKRG
jgi:molybdopterin-guanine dinucleotide biosynthesis protein A